jgi:hypothetical protein
MRIHVAGAFIALVIIPLLAPGGASAVELSPREVAEALRSCLPISAIREESPREGVPEARVVVEVSDAPSFDTRSVLDPAEVARRTDYFWLDRSGWISPTYETYSHARDPQVILWFPRYPGQTIGDADWPTIVAFRDRVAACLDASSGLTDREIDAVRWYDELVQAPSDRGGDRSGLPITDFPGVMLVPRRDVAILRDLFLCCASVHRDDQAGPPSWHYEIRLSRPEGSGEATLSGDTGRGAYEELADRAAAWGVGDCPLDASYCAFFHPFAQPGDKPDSEAFSGLTVKGQPAVVRHSTCCNGEQWVIRWYDPAEDLSYGLRLYLDVARRVGANNQIGPDNLRFASWLADTASDLVPLRPRDLRDRVPARVPR